MKREQILEVLNKYHDWVENELTYPVYNRSYIPDFANYVEALQEYNVNDNLQKEFNRIRSDLNVTLQENKPRMDKEQQCRNIIEKVKEAWTPDKRSFEQAEQENKPRMSAKEILIRFQPFYLNGDPSTGCLVYMKSDVQKMLEYALQESPTDEEIEAWADTIERRGCSYYNGLIAGALALRAGLIPHKKSE